MKFLRVVGFFVLGTSLVYAGNWKEEQTKPQVPATGQTAAPASATPADSAETKAPVATKAAPSDNAVPGDSTATTSPAAVDKSASGGHVVVVGDTLWDLSEFFYKDPFEWNKIWEANKSQIENPDLIYPDQKFVIPGTGKTASLQAPAAKAEAPAAEQKATVAPAEEPEPAAEPAKSEEASAPAEAEAEAEPAEESVPEATPPPVLVKKTAKSRGAYKTGTFLTNEKWEGAGKIVGDKEHKVLLGQSDVVYLNLGAADGIKAKMRGTIYRRGRVVRDPHTGDKMGYAINRVGVLEVTQEVTDNSATAVIVTSEDPVRVGDFFSLDE